jgi:hypothetical protein
MLVSWLFSPNVTVLRLVQPLKAEPPMLVTVDGIEMLVRLEQYANASSRILSSLLPSANVTLARLLQE